jgi:hypothetical protein
MSSGSAYLVMACERLGKTFLITHCKVAYLLILFMLMNWGLPAMAQFRYVSPVPNSLYNNAETNIILKNGDLVDPSSLDTVLVLLNGSTSGPHSCRIITSDDYKSILIYPLTIFAEGETITVKIADGFRNQAGEMITGTSFTFHIHAPRTAKQKEAIKRALEYARSSESDGNTYIENNATTRDACQIIPFTITSTTGAYDAEVFYRNFRADNPVCFGGPSLLMKGILFTPLSIPTSVFLLRSTGMDTSPITIVKTAASK